MSKLEGALAWQIKAAGLPEPVIEHRFHVERRWRFDFAWPDYMLAVECEGVFRGWDNRKSRHTTHSGYTADCEKYNNAAINGWKVLRFTTPMITSGEALQMIEQVLSGDDI